MFVEFEPTSRLAWRKWLEQNHTIHASIWLIIAKKGSGLPTLSLDDVVEEALCFGWIDSVPNKLDESRYKILLSPRKPKSNWSKINKMRANKMIKAGLMTDAGMKLIKLAKKTGTWNALENVDNLIIPDDLKDAFTTNKKAQTYFEAFPPSVKRGILEWIGNAKTVETRNKRILETVTLAANNIRANQYKPKSN
ncbi:MAG TPA: YdeI/OmpD-associated family protein [Cyclobacteriaceae bacterium]|nr:YdeI/OmpD-associated family protein [Cyclobacteriaceae bacterium]